MTTFGNDRPYWFDYETDIEQAHAAAKEEWLAEWDRATDPAIKGREKEEARKSARAAWGRYARWCRRLQAEQEREATNDGP